ncbi:MAG: heme lyase CcmF/NrfE family subunit [Gammaproteobacteria bacterium]|nr:heme lyase CcmF/NrfE family subunit [Gammaproteobacteria bacterium]
MIQFFGELSLYAALIFSLLQCVLPLLGFRHKEAHLLAFARPSAWAQAVFVFAAYLFLTIAFATNDFSIAYVAANSHPSLPLMYRLTAVWGAHEGSILLWILLLNLWTIFFSVSHTFFSLPIPAVDALPIKQKAVIHYHQQVLVLAILGCISFCFLIFLLFTSNPFLSSVGTPAGHDLNPLLQDPGFVIHPPMLYLGYVGFSVAFALTQAALLCKQLDSAWAYCTRRYALIAWCFLTLGITLGSWWAYRVLGWGGFWFWDPVENASLLPWLSGTAFIHVLILAEKRHIANAWAAFLAILCFALSLLGTFLVRSGVLISVHTFASDPARGLFLLTLFVVLLFASLIIYTYGTRSATITSEKPFSLFARETGLLLNSFLLFTAMFTILLGTLYPLILDALHLGVISIGAPYFNKVMMPLLFILMIVMGLGPLCQWQEQLLQNLWQQVWKKILLSFMLATLLLWGVTGHLDIIAIVSLSLSFWIIQSVLPSAFYLPGMSLAHIGFAVLVIGILLSSLLSEEREVRLHPGNIVTLGPYQFLFLNTQGTSDTNYRGIRANFDVIKNNHHVISLHPEKRIYVVRDMVMTKVDIHPGIFRDLYIALGEPLEGDDWSVRVYYKPFIRWIWFGGIMMMTGGFFAAFSRARCKYNEEK